ncbi:hypothetical protein BJY00DRAFT_63089 [Aspergillus carlsbadensis]|nr:hypothetical protein BJY00DRAFT_63089 [Aspergillus carlsbadensis]
MYFRSMTDLAWPRRRFICPVNPAYNVPSGDLKAAEVFSVDPLFVKPYQGYVDNMAEPSAGSSTNSSCTPDTPLFRSLKALPQDPSGRGFSHLAMDGVWRTFDKDRNVIGYYVLNPEEIAEVLTTFPLEIRERVEKELEGVDGHNVADLEQLMNPSAELLPPAEEHRRAIEAEVAGVAKRLSDGS